MNSENSTKTWVKKAYKKLKGNVYFDKTQAALLDQIVSFESKNLEASLNHIATVLDSSSENVWSDFVTDILDNIDVLVYPKKLKSYSQDQVIFNTDNEPIEMEKAQYFIEMPVIGHLLGILWVLTIGTRLDNREESESALMYEHSYGNRLRKNLYDSERKTITYSPYLFEPYFSQYENWRDTALAYAKERLADKQDALILTLDLRSFFYGVHIPQKYYENIYDGVKEAALPSWAKRVHNFVYAVMEEYSRKVRNINVDDELRLGQRVFLPIGFLPSYILSNWFLTPFDTAINEQINPVYYGRYVDDIIIVDKVEKNSPLRKRAQGTSANNSKLTVRDVIAYYFCSQRKGSGDFYEESPLFLPVAYEELSSVQKKTASKPINEKDATIYRINPSVLVKDALADIAPDIQIQNDKVKVFYFREGGSRALLDCFRTQVGQNASEFRFLPDMDDILVENNYSEIFKLQNDETLHKLRGVSGVTLSKFDLSKFLGKYRKAGGMIKDRKENAFDRDLLTILKDHVLIENYTLWDRLFEIMVVNNRLDNYEKLAINILRAINLYSTSNALVSENTDFRKALFLTLRTAICRTSALLWGNNISNVLKHIQESAEKNAPDNAELFSYEEIAEQRKKYCRSHMVNKYILPLPIGLLAFAKIEETQRDRNLCLMDDFPVCDSWDSTLQGNRYFPYIITPQEISYANACIDIAFGKDITDPEEQQKNISYLYRKLNYPALYETDNNDAFEEVKVVKLKDKNANAYAISIVSPIVKEIKVAVGNARLYESDFKKVLTGKPNRSHKRYQQVAKLLKEALEAKVDLLVLPESFLPWEWIPDIARLCANNQMALVTGVEHILSSGDNPEHPKVYNLTAVVLPYSKDEHKFAHVVYHHKVHYSPEEIRTIKGYRQEPFAGKAYQLFQWKDVWFSVYCCFELASITERALFQSYADLTIAVEWNRDITYFSSVIESLCRDLHCYCIQVNSSNYGDSRVISPTKTELRDIIKTKGGINHTILTDAIDVDALRDYQRKEYELQRDDFRFKPTPPKFNSCIPGLKQNGTLWEHLLDENEQAKV